MILCVRKNYPQYHWNQADSNLRLRKFTGKHCLANFNSAKEHLGWRAEKWKQILLSVRPVTSRRSSYSITLTIKMSAFRRKSGWSRYQETCRLSRFQGSQLLRQWPRLKTLWVKIRCPGDLYLKEGQDNTLVCCKMQNFTAKWTNRPRIHESKIA